MGGKAMNQLYLPPLAEVLYFLPEARLCAYDDSWIRSATSDGSDNGIELPDDDWAGNGPIELPDDKL